MKKSIFSIASFIAYIGGLLVARTQIGSVFIEGMAFLLSIFQISKEAMTKYQDLYEGVVVGIFIIIGIRFYWHAEHIDNNNEFFENATNTRIRRIFDFILRTTWILLALLFPIVCSNNLVGDKVDTITVLFGMFFLMYFSMYIWCHLFLDIFLEQSGRLNRNNKFLISTFDSFALALFFFLPLFSWILMLVGYDKEIISLAFLVSAIFTAGFTAFQLIIFVFIYLCNPVEGT